MLWIKQELPREPGSKAGPEQLGVTGQAGHTELLELSVTGHWREEGSGAGLAPSRFLEFLHWKCRLKGCLGRARGMTRFGSER